MNAGWWIILVCSLILAGLGGWRVWVDPPGWLVRLVERLAG